MPDADGTASTGTIPPAASVIIPCRNSTRTLGLQLEALARQVDAPPFEIIVADNGSADDLAGLLDPWRGRLSLKLVDAAEHPGAAYARNVGMSFAVADKLLFCDSDDIVARDWVSRGCEALDLVDVFSGPGLRVADGAIGDDLDDIWRRLDRELEPDLSVRPRATVPWPIILGGNSGMRRATAEAVRGYDAGLPGDVEDNDLAIRLQDAGFAIASAPGVRIVYRSRTGARSAFRSARSRGVSHVSLCARHDIAERSPVLASGRWRSEPIRVAASGCRMLLRPKTRDLEGLASRAGLAIGVYEGQVRQAMGRDRALPMIGVGWEEGVSEQLLDRPTLILSPHLDDALFSAAELIRRGTPEVWTVFAGEPTPPITTDWDRSCGFSDSRQALEVRCKEDTEAFAGSAARVRRLDHLDGAYTTPERRRRDLTSLIAEVTSWVSAHAGSDPVVVLPACAGVPVARATETNDGRRTELARRAERSPLAPLLAPLRTLKHRLYLRRRRHAQALGLAVNDDHVAVRDAVGDALAGVPEVTLALMEDLPYLWWYPADEAVAAVAARWRRAVVPLSNPVDRAWKHERIRQYSSQLEVMDRVERRLARADTLPRRERLWVLPPHGINPETN
ncbi:glycosyltransferase family 2 protein [uncultured Microbacterium sp.]|uniref:glycosyltransferase family 2 protein n=1 Tax=uncultured Microbacterium sp. TaxID=191216 RepID=UPI0025EBC80B|nr:glycosyltransferase family A protein [uncultured Microbacterium sp.]